MSSPQRDNRTGVYYIRVSIPKSLRPYFKDHFKISHEWKKQLVDPDTGEKARSETQAKRLWASYYAEWEVSKGAASAALVGQDYKLSDKQTDALCADWIAQQLGQYEEDIPISLDRELIKDHFFDVFEVNRYSDKPSFGKLRRYFENNPYVANEAASLLNTHKVPLARGSDAFLVFCERLARAGMRFVEALEGRSKGNWSTPEVIVNAPLFEGISSDQSETIRQVYDKYKSERQLDERQLMEHGKPINDFIALVGNLPIARVTPAHVRSYKDQQLASGLASINVSGRLSVLRRVLGYAINNGLIKTNPAAAIKTTKNKKEGRPRKPWSFQEIQILLDGPVHKDGKRPSAGQGEAAFWLPLLGLFTGARLEDLAQLRIEDVGETSNGTVYIDINSNHGKQLKNDSTPRKVPLHRQLLKWGFLKYVKSLKGSGVALLFPGVETYRKQAAKAWGQWFGNYKRKQLKIDPKEVRKDFHSFRHGFKDAARNSGIQKDIRDQLQGHAPGTVGEGYGEGYSLDVLKMEIDKLVYEGVDFSFLGSGNET